MQSTRLQVLKFLRDEPDQAVEDIQDILLLACQNDCEDCDYSHLCIAEGCYIEDTTAVTVEPEPKIEQC